MINLVIDPRDPALVPLGPSTDGASIRPVDVTVATSRTVRLAAGGFVLDGAKVRKQIPAGGSLTVSVPATDGTEIHADDRSTFVYVVTLEVTTTGRTRDTVTRTFRGLLPTSLGATVQVTSLVDGAPVPSEYVSAADLLEALSSGGGAYSALSVPAVTTYAATRDTSLDLNVTADATFTLSGTKLGMIVGLRVDPNGNTLTFPGGTTVTGTDPVTATAWRMAEGWVYSVGGAGSTEPPDPGDTVAPVAGTLAASAISDSGFTLTVSGASDETALNATPYSFTTDGGTTWSAWQASPVFVVTGKTASTAYTCRHQVRDNADPVHATLGTSITVTTTAVAGVLTFAGQTTAASDSAHTVTYSAVPIGTASASRHLIVALSWWAGGSRDPGLTINGGSALTPVYSTGNAAQGVKYFVASVPTGTTADVVATGDGINGYSPTIAVWTANQLPTLVSGSFTDAASGSTGGTVSTTSVAGGFALAAFRSRSGAFATAWTGITERWERALAQPGSGGDMSTPGTTASATATFTPASDFVTRIGLAAFKWGA